MSYQSIASLAASTFGILSMEESTLACRVSALTIWLHSARSVKHKAFKVTTALPNQIAV